MSAEDCLSGDDNTCPPGSVYRDLELSKSGIEKFTHAFAVLDLKYPSSPCLNYFYRIRITRASHVLKLTIISINSILISQVH